MFAAAAISIVSGAVCERIKLSSFLLFGTLFSIFVYPVLGSWKWGGGFLDSLGFHDLAGSTIVHSVGGWAALVGTLFLGPRLGKYVNGKTSPILGHNIPLAVIGTFFLWFGWFGFNAGSQLDANPLKISHIMLTTLLSSCGGILGSMLCSWYIQKKPDITMILNGCLAGLVGITAGADVISPNLSILVGFISGILVVLSVLFIDRLKIDDSVGAISVHLVTGIWGTLAVGIFSKKSFLVQVIGVIAYGLAALILSTIIFFLIKKTIGLRVTQEEELKGLDLSEHSSEAYSGFQIFSNQ